MKFVLAVGEVEVRLHRGAVSHPAGVIAAWRGVRPVRPVLGKLRSKSLATNNNIRL
jgi:hypothetical protein